MKTMDTNPGKQKKLALVILDGWGHSTRTEFNAIASASTPNWMNGCEVALIRYWNVRGCQLGCRRVKWVARRWVT